MALEPSCTPLRGAAQMESTQLFSPHSLESSHALVVRHGVPQATKPQSTPSSSSCLMPSSHPGSVPSVPPVLVSEPPVPSSEPPVAESVPPELVPPVSEFCDLEPPEPSSSEVSSPVPPAEELESFLLSPEAESEEPEQATNKRGRQASSR